MLFFMVLSCFFVSFMLYKSFLIVYFHERQLNQIDLSVDGRFQLIAVLLE